MPSICSVASCSRDPSADIKAYVLSVRNQGASFVKACVLSVSNGGVTLVERGLCQVHRGNSCGSSRWALSTRSVVYCSQDLSAAHGLWL